MRCVLISVVLLMISPYFSDANWCINETTSYTKVTKVLTKIITSRKWHGGIKRKTVSYTVTELFPRIRQNRVCCEGYTLDSINRICEPNCPSGCPHFSGCIKPNICECHNGYRMKGDSCEPICEPTCSVNAFCSNSNVCKCKSGFEFNDSTKSCESLDRSFTTLEDISTIPEFHTKSIEKLTTISTTLEPPSSTSSSRTTSESASTETIRNTSKKTSTTSKTTSETPSTDTTRTSEMESSSSSSSAHGRNSICIYSKNCADGDCRLVLDHCQCNEGFVKADLSCHIKSGFKPDDDCIEESLCKELKTTTSTEQILSSEVPETTTSALEADVSSNCEYKCFNGICIDGLCQCPNGSVFSSKSNGCINNSSCDKICSNGVCQENGVCECLNGFFYQYDRGCVPNCEQKCINGICIAPRKCKCLDGFDHNPEKLFECIPTGKLSEKLKRHYDILDFPWIWVVSAILILVVFGLFIIKKSRSHIYNVDKIEEARHIVHFESNGL